MKVLMVFTSKFHYTGITKVVMNYYEQLKKNDDIIIDFVVPNEIDEKLKESIDFNKSKVKVLPMKLRRKRVLRYIIELSNFIKSEKYDIVHVHGSSSIMATELFAAKLAGCKVRIAHSHNTVTEHKLLHYILYPLFNMLYTDAFACGEAAGKWLFKNKKFTIINNAQCIDKFIFNENIRKDYRDKYKLNDKIVIGHVGAFNYQKNHEFLIDVFNELTKKNDKYFLVLIGEGPLFEEVKEKVYKFNLKDKVLFVGKTLYVNEWLNAMDVMVLPSRYEGLPNVLIEWQISGLPCLISNNITSSVAITDLVHFCELDTKMWIQELNNIDFNLNRKNSLYMEQIRNAGYDIKYESNKLIDIYTSMLENK